MSYHVRFTERSLEAYEALKSQFGERWGEEYVQLFRSKVDKCLVTISISPFQYQIFDEVTGLRRCVLHKNHSLLYTINDDEVLIFSFWDNRQDPIFGSDQK